MNEKKTYHCCVDVTYTQWIYVDAESEEDAIVAAKDEATDMHPNSLVLHGVNVDSVWEE
jgi:hypothetical protein|tara:strand:- start:35 stop:211 length:177 start_codon:yes stop_codon:yes gene_type:complete